MHTLYLKTELQVPDSTQCAAARMFEKSDEQACLSQLYIYLTTECSKNCDFCWQHSSATQLDLQILAKILDSLPVPPKKIILLGGDLLTCSLEYLREAYALCTAVVLEPDDVSFVTDLLYQPESRLAFFSEMSSIKTSVEFGRYTSAEWPELISRFQEFGRETPITILSAITERMLCASADEIIDRICSQLPFSKLAFFPLIGMSVPNYYQKAETLLYQVYSKLTSNLRPLVLSYSRLLLAGTVSASLGLLYCPDRFFLSISPQARIYSGVLCCSAPSVTTNSFSAVALSNDEFQNQLQQLRRCTTKLTDSRCLNCPLYNICSGAQSFPGWNLFDRSSTACHGFRHLVERSVTEIF